MARIIALVGGGTMGPTAPLFALYSVMSQRNLNDRFVWAGTEEGPERGPVEALGIPFISIPSAKIPRYASYRWLTFVSDYFKARRAADKLLDEWKPNIIIGAGGFTQVPIMRRAAKRGIPCVIHQLDFKPTWSNLAVSKYCKLITTAFVYHYSKFRPKPEVEEKSIATPNRFAGCMLIEKSQATNKFGLNSEKPIILVLGGGTGAKSMNKIIEDNLEHWLSKVQIIHSTGRGRSDYAGDSRQGYSRHEFLDKEDLFNAFAAADLVITRGGMGTVTDIAALSKPSIMIPIPKSHQEKNSRHLPLATVEVKEGTDFFNRLYRTTIKLLHDPAQLKSLGLEMHKLIKTDNGAQWADLIEKFLPDDID